MIKLVVLYTPSPLLSPSFSLCDSLHVTLSCCFNLLVNDNEALSVSVCLGHTGAPQNLASFEVCVCACVCGRGDVCGPGPCSTPSHPYKPMWYPPPTHAHTHSCWDGIRAPFCWPLRQREIGIFVCVLVSMGVMDVWLKTLLTLQSPAALQLKFCRLFEAVCVCTHLQDMRYVTKKRGRRHRLCPTWIGCVYLLSQYVFVCVFVCVCVQLHKGSQIGPQKTPSDVSRQYSPVACVCVCVDPHCLCVCVWATGASVLYGTMVIRTTGGRPDRKGVFVCVCLWRPPLIWPFTMGAVMSFRPS